MEGAWELLREPLGELPVCEPRSWRVCESASGKPRERGRALWSSPGEVPGGAAGGAALGASRVWAFVDLVCESASGKPRERGGPGELSRGGSRGSCRGSRPGSLPCVSLC